MSAHLTQQKNALLEAFNNLTEPSQSGTFVFTQYTKYQVAQDGYVFWVATGNTITVNGALHISTDREQELDDTIAMNVVMLDTGDAITEFNAVDTASLWVAEIADPTGDGTVQIAFQRRGPYFENAGVYHYMGFAVFAPFADILVSSESDIPAGPIVSNSLPIWMALQTSLAGLPGNQFPANIPVYPSFLVPENAQPPYIVAHIEPDRTTALQAFPATPWPGGSTGPQDCYGYQLAKDHVELILYGLSNQQALQLLAALTRLSTFSDQFGFMSMPIVRDYKRTQAEIMAIALKKSIEFAVSYYQSTADAIARQLITSAALSYEATT